MDNLWTLVSDWESNLLFSQSLSANTAKSYLHDFKLFVHFLEQYRNEKISLSSILDVSISDWRAWVLFRKNEHTKSRSIARELSALKSWFSFLIERKIIGNHVMLSVKPPKTNKTLPRPLSIPQINSILASLSTIKQTDWIVMRDKAIVVLVYSVGLRISEALSINIKDIQNTEYINIKGKGSKYRLVPLIKEVSDILAQYIGMIPFCIEENTPLFLNKFGERLSASAVQKIIKVSRRKLNLAENVTPHALRHTCASHIMEKSGDIRGIQELLGHSSLSSTQIYTAISKKHITDIYDKFHPMSKRTKL